MSRVLRLLFFVGILAVVTPAAADDITGANKLVCAATSVILCADNGECAAGQPAELNVPQFIQIDLGRKQMSTTETSGQSRSTPITKLESGPGEIVIQEYEVDRAASFVIAEKTGRLSAAIAAQDFTISVFGACTPAASSR